MNDTWNQFGGNETGSGFRLVNGAHLSAATWHAFLPAAVTTSSPVIGPDGTVYVGTLDGKLTAFGPRGVMKWSVQIGLHHTAVATPAVAADGTIYCLCTSIVRDHRLGPPLPPQPGPANFVVSVSSDGTIRWTVPIRVLGSALNWDTGQIHGAPRIVSAGSKARVIFVIRYTLQIPYPEIDGIGPEFRAVLAIVDEHGTFLLFQPYEVDKLFIDVTGGGGFDFGGATLGDAVDRNAVPLPKSVAANTDTPAVFGSIRSKDAWTIVAPGRLGLYAIRWNDSEGALASQPGLVWKGDSPVSPCAFPNGLITAFSKNVVTILEKDTFTPYAAHPIYFNGTGTVAGGLRQMYFLTRPFGELLLVDTNGTIVRTVELHADSVAYRLAADCVYVSTSRGIRRYSLDLTTLLADLTYPPGPPGGVSSPAIGANGSVYHINQFQGRHVLYVYENP